MQVISPITYEERLTWLMTINPKFAIEILEFMENNPEFLKVGHLIALTEYPNNYNMNPGENLNPYAPTCVFEHLVHYIAEAGVRASYGNDQWKIISDYIRLHKDDPLTNLLIDINTIQPKKKQVYIDLNLLLIDYNISPYNLTYLQAIMICDKLKGVGDGCRNSLQLFYKQEDITLPDYTDIGFKKGFMKFYNLPKKPTKKQIFDITKNWSNIKIGNMIIMQCYHYL